MVRTVGITFEYARFLARRLRNWDLELAIDMVIADLNVPANSMGYHYLKTAIALCYEDPARLLLSDVYVEAGKRYTAKASYKQVEQQIRHVISIAWEDRDDEVWQMVFRPNRDGEIEKPSNSKFLYQMVGFLQMLRRVIKEGLYD